MILGKIIITSAVIAAVCGVVGVCLQDGVNWRAGEILCSIAFTFVCIIATAAITGVLYLIWFVI